MLTYLEYLACVLFAQAVGQRRFGHFDHDANCASGPFPPSDRAASPVRKASERDTGATVHLRYERFVDPDTGAPRFRTLS